MLIWRIAMTKREAAVISAYTGIFIGDITEFYEYIKELMGRPVFTHEIPGLTDELQKRSEKDFMKLHVE